MYRLWVHSPALHFCPHTHTKHTRCHLEHIWAQLEEVVPHRIKTKVFLFKLYFFSVPEIKPRTLYMEVQVLFCRTTYFNFCSALFFFSSYIEQCSELSSGSVLKICWIWGSGDYLWYWRLNSDPSFPFKVLIWNGSIFGMITVTAGQLQLWAHSKWAVIRKNLCVG